ncbi:MAG: iron-siderophore ABC transporter substrate-binding protein [Mycetocola sp.]
MSATAVAVLAACSGAPTDAGSASAGAEADAAGDAFPTTVDTAFGGVTVDARPERVVALGWGDAEAALALGVQPVGASDWLAFGGSGVGPWAEDLYDTAPEIIGTLEPSYESILALKPDLILDVKSSGDAERYKRLSEIAPTVGIPEGGENYLASTEEQMTMIGQALGLSDQSTALMTELDASFAAQREQHPEFDGATSTAAVLTTDGWSAYVSGDSRTSFLEQLGFVQNPSIAAIDAEGAFTVPVPSEDLSILDSDLIVTFLIGVTAEDATGEKLFQDLPAVAAGHSVVMSNELESKAFSIGSVLATEYALTHVVPQLSEAIAQ